MKVDVRPLNKEEIFCCSIKKAKELFKNTEVHLDFACLGRRNFGTFVETPDAYYVKRNIKGKVTASMYMRTRQENPIISFYVLKEKDFSIDLKSEFEQKHLPKFYESYIKQLNNQSILSTTIFMCVELFQGKLTKHLATF